MSLRGIRSFLLNRWAAIAEERLGNQAVDHLLSCDLAAFERTGSGTHADRLNAVMSLREQVSGQTIMTIVDLPFAFLYLGLLAWLGGWLVALPVVALLVLLPITVRQGRRLHLALERLGNSENARSDFVVAALSGLQTIKSMAGEAAIARRYESMNEERALVGREVELVTQSLGSASATVSQVVMFGSVVFGSLLVVNGELSVGVIAACTLVSGRVLQPFQAATGFWARMQSMRVARGQAEALFALPREARPTGSVDPAVPHRLTFLNVGYGDLFRDVSFELEPGRPVALVGPSGSGKSMLLALAAGLHQPTEGSVLLDGVRLASIDPQDRARAICLISQRETLFRGTILENLSGFRPDLESAAMTAAEQAGLSEIIRSLPRGYETEVGDALSGSLPRGLAQQIAIARAVALAPPVLLFDDADNALDDDADLAVRRTLAELGRTRAMILVSHRPSMLKLAEEIYRLADGHLDRGMRETEAVA